MKELPHIAERARSNIAWMAFMDQKVTEA